MISTEDIRRWIRSYADRIAEQKAYLTKLDSPIGDGDHGQNMNRGMQAAVQNLDGSDTPGAVLKTVAMGLISKTGGASGPLYGTFFLDASKQAPDDGIDLASFAAMMRGGLDGVKRRGNAEPGDKTMVDAITPAVEALEQAAADASPPSLADALQATAEAAREGMEATTPMVAKKGRASYLGERSKGHQDPGATSSYYLFETAAHSLSAD
mgnify:CR=1 FL=1